MNPSPPETAERQPAEKPQTIVRAIFPGAELRDVGGASLGTLFGHFAVFNRWTEINSWFEGNFMERFAPGAFKKTISENGKSMRVLFQHGFDPMVGDKPLGPIADLREDDNGAYYEVPLLDTSYVRDIRPGLEAGLYGASFRFQSVKEALDEEPGPSRDNPKGLPERTITEARVLEFGPVTFPAYADASAGVRSVSLTDKFHERNGIVVPRDIGAGSPVPEPRDAAEAEEPESVETDLHSEDEERDVDSETLDGAGSDHSEETEAPRRWFEPAAPVAAPNRGPQWFATDSQGE